MRVVELWFEEHVQVNIMKQLVLEPLLPLCSFSSSFSYRDLYYTESEAIDSDKVILEGGDELGGDVYVMAFKTINTPFPPSVHEFVIHLVVCFH